MTTLIGIVTFGNLPFTKLAVQAIRATANRTVKLFVVVGKDGDEETWQWLHDERIPNVRHSGNWGFPASINDIYDCAWLRLGFDNLILCGNDVIPYPGAIDALIDCARETDWEWIASSQFDAASLVRMYPETKRYFQGDGLLFTDFSARPWEMHPPFAEPAIIPDCIADVRNLCLFKRSVFEKLGYADVNFWPGGYFEDNDYCTRALRAGVKTCALRHSVYFHFWSRTIHQGGRAGGFHDRTFHACERYYRMKWGGPFQEEKWQVPFDGGAPEIPVPYPAVPPGEVLLKIHTREHEEAMVEYWARRNPPNA